jgi:hypothetical protein
MQLGPVGNVSFRGTAVNGGTLPNNIWNVRIDGTVEPILVRGLPIPGLGTPTLSTQLTSQWIDGGRYTTWVRLMGGSIRTAIIVFGPS